MSKPSQTPQLSLEKARKAHLLRALDKYLALYNARRVGQRVNMQQLRDYGDILRIEGQVNLSQLNGEIDMGFQFDQLRYRIDRLFPKDILPPSASGSTPKTQSRTTIRAQTKTSTAQPRATTPQRPRATSTYGPPSPNAQPTGEAYWYLEPVPVPRVPKAGTREAAGYELVNRYATSKGIPLREAHQFIQATGGYGQSDIKGRLDRLQQKSKDFPDNYGPVSREAAARNPPPTLTREQQLRNTYQALVQKAQAGLLTPKEREDLNNITYTLNHDYHANLTMPPATPPGTTPGASSPLQGFDLMRNPAGWLQAKFPGTITPRASTPAPVAGNGKVVLSPPITKKDLADARKALEKRKEEESRAQVARANNAPPLPGYERTPTGWVNPNGGFEGQFLVGQDQLGKGIKPPYQSPQDMSFHPATMASMAAEHERPSDLAVLRAKERIRHLVKRYGLKVAQQRGDYQWAMLVLQNADDFYMLNNDATQQDWDDARREDENEITAAEIRKHQAVPDLYESHPTTFWETVAAPFNYAGRYWGNVLDPNIRMSKTQEKLADLPMLGKTPEQQRMILDAMQYNTNAAERYTQPNSKLPNTPAGNVAANLLLGGKGVIEGLGKHVPLLESLDIGGYTPSRNITYWGTLPAVMAAQGRMGEWFSDYKMARTIANETGITLKEAMTVVPEYKRVLAVAARETPWGQAVLNQTVERLQKIPGDTAKGLVTQQASARLFNDREAQLTGEQMMRQAVMEGWGKMAAVEAGTPIGITLPRLGVPSKVSQGITGAVENIVKTAATEGEITPKSAIGIGTAFVSPFLQPEKEAAPSSAETANSTSRWFGKRKRAPTLQLTQGASQRTADTAPSPSAPPSDSDSADAQALRDLEAMQGITNMLDLYFYIGPERTRALLKLRNAVGFY